MESKLKYLRLRLFAPLMTVVIMVLQPLYSQKVAATQVLTLRVLELNKIDLSGGPLTINVNGYDDLKEFNADTDEGMKLTWTINGEPRKIAIGSNVTSPQFILKIKAEKSGAWNGTAESEVTLDDHEPRDLIVGVQRSSGSCTLKFSAVATADQQNESASNLIIYTVTGG